MPSARGRWTALAMIATMRLFTRAYPSLLGWAGTSVSLHPEDRRDDDGRALAGRAVVERDPEDGALPALERARELGVVDVLLGARVPAEGRERRVRRARSRRRRRMASKPAQETGWSAIVQPPVA